MARKPNYGFNKRQKEKLKAEKAELKRIKREERKAAEEAGTDANPYGDPDIKPIDPGDLGLPAEEPAAKKEDSPDPA